MQMIKRWQQFPSGEVSQRTENDNQAWQRCNFDTKSAVPFGNGLNCFRHDPALLFFEKLVSFPDKLALHGSKYKESCDVFFQNFHFRLEKSVKRGYITE
jgi:hypothetical protein